MDELNRKLEEILNDPQSMNKVRMLAESLLGDETEPQNNEDNAGSINAADIGRIVNIIGSLENQENNNRAKLLLALKPHLTQKRHARVDSAVKLLKLIEALPLLREAGILDFGG